MSNKQNPKESSNIMDLSTCSKDYKMSTEKKHFSQKFDYSSKLYFQTDTHSSSRSFKKKIFSQKMKCLTHQIKFEQEEEKNGNEKGDEISTSKKDFNESQKKSGKKNIKCKLIFDNMDCYDFDCKSSSNSKKDRSNEKEMEIEDEENKESENEKGYILSKKFLFEDNNNNNSFDDLSVDYNLNYTKEKGKNDLKKINESNSKKKFDEEYTIIRTLRIGEMGTVYLCSDNLDNKIYVVKETNFFSKNYDFQNMAEFDEIIKKNKSDPESIFILKYISFWLESPFTDLEKELNKYKPKNMYIVTEYCPCGTLNELMSEIMENEKYSQIFSDFYWDIVFQMIISVYYLHKLGYVHFDIKPENYLISLDGKLLLNDFCLTLKEKDIQAATNSDDLEGDSRYISPELFYKNSKITHKIDIYSLGLSILEVLTGMKLPINGTMWQVIRKFGIPKVYLGKIEFCKANYNKERVINLIQDLINPISEQRKELNDILNDDIKYPELYQKFHLLLLNNYQPAKTQEIIQEICKERVNRFEYERNERGSMMYRGRRSSDSFGSLDENYASG